MSKPASPRTPADPYQLADWWIFPEECLVRQAAAPASEARKITPRAMDVLFYLSERPRQVVSADELLSVLWSGTFTSANSAQKCIAELRNAFDDDARNPCILQTIPKRGYKLLVAPEVRAPEAIAPAPAPEDDRREPGRAPATGWLRPALGIGVFTLLASVTIVGWFSASTSPLDADADVSCNADSAAGDLCREAKPTSVAVLKFKSADDPEAQLLADALSDILLGSLHQIKHLEVAARRDSFDESAGRGSSREVGQRLGVEHVLEGDLRIEADDLRVAVQLVNVQTGKELYSETIVRPRSAAFDLQDDIAARVMKALKIHLNDAERQAMLATGTRNIEAFLEHKRAFALVNSGSFDNLSLATQHARRALELDPDFVSAYQCLLIAYESMPLHLSIAQSELVRREVNAITAEIALTMPNSTLHKWANFISARLNTDQTNVINFLTNGIRAGERSDYAAMFGGMLLQAGLLDEGEAYQREYLTERGLPTGPSLYRLLQQGDMQGVIAKRREMLIEFPDNVVYLAGQINDLARVGELDEARELLARLETADTEGVWTLVGRHTMLMREGAMTKGDETYRAFMDHPLSTRASRGHLAFMYGDVAGGIEHWHELSPVELRVLLQNLGFMQLDYPKEVLAHAGYQATLDRLGLGQQWQRYLAFKVSALAPTTGIAMTSVPELQVALAD